MPLKRSTGYKKNTTRIFVSKRRLKSMDSVDRKITEESTSNNDITVTVSRDDYLGVDVSLNTNSSRKYSTEKKSTHIETKITNGRYLDRASKSNAKDSNNDYILKNVDLANGKRSCNANQVVQVPNSLICVNELKKKFEKLASGNKQVFKKESFKNEYQNTNLSIDVPTMKLTSDKMEVNSGKSGNGDFIMLEDFNLSTKRDYHKSFEKLNEFLQEKEIKCKDIVYSEEQDIYEAVNTIKIAKYILNTELPVDCKTSVRESEKIKYLTGNLRYHDNNLEKCNKHLQQKSSLENSRVIKIINELIKTETDYINTLDYTIQNYMEYKYQLNEKNLYENEHLVFGNIELIYLRSKRFLNSIKRCNYNYEEIGQTFLNFEKLLFDLYPDYCKLSAKTEYYINKYLKDVIEERQRMLKEKFSLVSYLMQPVQRIMRYPMLLTEIKEELNNISLHSKEIENALLMVRAKAKKGDDLVAIDSIENLPFGLSETGSFVKKENFVVVKPKKYETTLFLFENLLIFTTNNSNLPQNYIYKESIKITELGFVKWEEYPLEFLLQKFAEKEKVTYELVATEKKKKEEWTKELEKRLWMQFEEYRNKLKSKT